MKSHNKEKHVNIDDLSQPQLIMQHFRNYDLDKNGKIDGLELLKAALIMNGKDLLRSCLLCNHLMISAILLKSYLRALIHVFIKFVQVGAKTFCFDCFPA